MDHLCVYDWKPGLTFAFRRFSIVFVPGRKFLKKRGMKTMKSNIHERIDTYNRRLFVALNAKYVFLFSVYISAVSEMKRLSFPLSWKSSSRRASSALERGYVEMSALHCGSRECVEPIKELQIGRAHV